MHGLSFITFVTHGLIHKLIILCMSVNKDWQNSENLFWFCEYAHPLISVKKSFI